tara:strand:- start:735 stop:893 length:159 start_codon:yes stop_codon:yes gene_type:complete
MTLKIRGKTSGLKIDPKKKISRSPEKQITIQHTPVNDLKIKGRKSKGYRGIA